MSSSIVGKVLILTECSRTFRCSGRFKPVRISLVRTLRVIWTRDLGPKLLEVCFSDRTIAKGFSLVDFLLLPIFTSKSFLLSSLIIFFLKLLKNTNLYEEMKFMKRHQFKILTLFWNQMSTNMEREKNWRNQWFIFKAQPHCSLKNGEIFIILFLSIVSRGWKASTEVS